MSGASVEQGSQAGQGRVPLPARLFFGSGAAAEGTQNVAFNVFLLFYYNQVLGLSGSWTGAALFLALCIDALMDPLVGSLSDGWRSRFGRRHPFMYAAALPMAASFLLLFRPPEGLAGPGLFAWLLACSVGVRVSMTLYQIPSGAMVPELTTNYDERTSLVSWRVLFGWMGAIVIAQLGYLVHFGRAADGADGRLDPSRYAGFGLTCALAAGSVILLSSLGTHRLIPRLRSVETTPFTLKRFAGELRDVARNRSFRMLLGASLFASVAGGFSDVVGLYVNTYFWELSTEQLAVLVYGLIASVLVGFAVTSPLTARFDKKRAALGLAGIAIGLGPLPIFLRLLGWFPPNGDPLIVPLLFVHNVIVVACVVSIGIIVASMIADVVDENELLTGRRQEGLFMATIAFTTKATSGLGGLCAGIALDVIAFPRGSEPGAVAPEKVEALGLAVGPGLMLLFLLTLVFLARYDMTRERHRQVLEELAARPRGGGAP
jgi:Na+/melibiose symporter-like transporter